MTEGPTTPPPPSSPPPPGEPSGAAGAGPGGPPRSFVERVTGALRLDAGVFDEVEHDESALPQAAGVVAIAAVCSGIGGAAGGAGGVLSSVVGAFVGWLLGAAIVWAIGVRLMGHTSDYPELLRTLGFASAPQLFLILAFLPVLGALVALVVFAWGLAAYVVAVRQALDVETGRAVVVCVLAWGAAILIGLVLRGLFGTVP